MPDLERLLRITNRNMIAFDIVLGSSAVLAPDATLRALGHRAPSPDARELLRKNGPVWLTFAAAHAMAAARGEPRDWWALAWLRATEIGTDVLWRRSEGFSEPRGRAWQWLAGASNLAMAVGFGTLARRGG
jgi:hypothetical protein